jgi:hypothetical protein
MALAPPLATPAAARLGAAGRPVPAAALLVLQLLLLLLLLLLRVVVVSP